MENYNLKTSMITILLVVYTAIVMFSLAMSLSGGQLPPVNTLLMPIVGVCCLLIFIVFMILTVLKTFKNKISLLEEEVHRVENERDTLRSDHEKIIEKRTLEISVINASLNREIAERMEAESSALALKKQMELILNSAGEGIFGLDINGAVIFANTSALLMIGYEKEELIGRSHHELVHHSHADNTAHEEKDCPIRQAYEDGIVHSCSNDVFWTKEGTSFPVEYVSTPIIDNSHICGAVVVFRDTSMFS